MAKVNKLKRTKVFRQSVVLVAVAAFIIFIASILYSLNFSNTNSMQPPEIDGDMGWVSKVTTRGEPFELIETVTVNNGFWSEYTNATTSEVLWWGWAIHVLLSIMVSVGLVWILMPFFINKTHTKIN